MCTEVLKGSQYLCGCWCRRRVKEIVNCQDVNCRLHPAHRGNCSRVITVCREYCPHLFKDEMDGGIIILHRKCGKHAQQVS
jgi:hypothetical protein